MSKRMYKATIKFLYYIGTFRMYIRYCTNALFYTFDFGIGFSGQNNLIRPVMERPACSRTEENAKALRSALCTLRKYVTYIKRTRSLRILIKGRRCVMLVVYELYKRTFKGETSVIQPIQ